MISGGPTPGGFTVISKPVGGTSLRLKVATNSGLHQQRHLRRAQTPDQYGYVQARRDRAEPVHPVLLPAADTPPGGTEAAVGSVGTCKTLAAPGSIQSFTFAIASCINTADETPGPDTALNDWIAWGADLNIFTGDYGYQNPTTLTSHPRSAHSST